MKKTDYSKIAETYDKNKLRLVIEPDDILFEHYKNTDEKDFHILDLACGTGNYIKTQYQYFYNYKIKWYGLDASEEMLKVAREKLKDYDVDLTKGMADKTMPFHNSKFDYISNNYAFHHFQNKFQALDEIARIIKSNGVFRLKNVHIFDLEHYWLYRYFPVARLEDEKRFWSASLLFHELEKRGFEAELEIKYGIEKLKLAEIEKIVKNKDISQLTIISENDYQEGAGRIAFELAKSPDKIIVSDISHITCVATKAG